MSFVKNCFHIEIGYVATIDLVECDLQIPLNATVAGGSKIKLIEVIAHRLEYLAVASNVIRDHGNTNSVVLLRLGPIPRQPE